MYLFIDTTFEITIGLLDKNFDWLEYQHIQSNKSSAVVHKMVFDLLEKNGLKVVALDGVFFSAGPGSYTGMRVSEGIKDIFEWQGIKVNSFYHFDIPQLSGESSGQWVSKAFKGEYFVFEWDEKEEKRFFIKESELDDFIKEKHIYSHEDFGDNCNTDLTRDLIHKNSEQIFSLILKNNLVKSLYYYRTLDQEFTRKL